jgi:TonB family protein
MNVLALFLAVLLISFALPLGAVARAPGAGCASSAAKLVNPPKLSLPEDPKPTAQFVIYEVDVGSDGRVRGVQLDQTSGDGAIDLSARQMLQSATYAPPQTGCVAYSGGLIIPYPTAPDVSGTPPQPSALNPNCTPFVSAFLSPIARDRKRTGTAIVAVELDASGTRTAPPALRKSTGSPVLDQEALRIAATGHYAFLRGSSCTPQAFTDLLELTFQ